MAKVQTTLHLVQELREIYSSHISSGNTKTRETNDASIAKFLKTKASNMRDYADACFRYLRATGLINISHLGKSVSIVHEKIQEVDYFLQNTDREPCFIDDEERYAYCLFIAPNINDACKAHFYALHKMNIQYYGGTSTIVPLPLSVFIKMVEDSYNASFVPEPRHIQRFFERSKELAASTINEVEWYDKITQEALNWLTE